MNLNRMLINKFIANLTLNIIFISVSIKSNAQDSLSKEMVSKYSYSFTINKKQFIGEGWDSLKSSIGKSQFVLLGENHSSPLLSDFTSILLSEMHKLKFSHFIIETGPVASLKLKALWKKDKYTFGDKLNNFLSANKLKEGCPPAEFIAMKNDIEMYNAAYNNKYSVQGIDKEYLYSYKYLLHELKQYCTTVKLKNMFYMALTQQEFIDSTYLNTKDYKRITQYQNNIIINEFLDNVAGVSNEAVSIVEQIRISWKIYYLYEIGKYYESEESRIKNLKNNFGKYYYSKSHKELYNFKALIKYGNVHTERGESYLRHLDLGNMFSELAALNGTQSLHIMGMRRYRYNEKGEIMDFLNDGYEIYPNVISMADKNSWVIIDLRPIKEMLVSGRIKANKDESNLIRKNDYVLLTPIDGAYKTSLNYH